MRRAGIVVGLGVFLLTVAWWMLLISPKNSQIADLEDELNVAIGNEQLLRVTINELEAIRQAEVEYLAALGQLESLIPERPLLEEFIEQIHALTTDTGIDLQTLASSVPSISDDSLLREISVSAQIEGEFFEILGFLFGLNDMERLVRVDAVAVSSSTDDVEGTVLSASVQMTLFTLADLIPLLEEVGTVAQDEAPPVGDGAGDLEATGPSA
jgi:Tfp pilus assembly protein PilO